MLKRTIIFLTLALFFFINIHSAILAMEKCPFKTKDLENSLEVNIDSLELYGEVISIVHIKDECPHIAPQKVLIKVINNDGGCRGENWFFIKDDLQTSKLQPGYRFSFLINKSECTKEKIDSEDNSPMIILKLTGE